MQATDSAYCPDLFVYYGSNTANGAKVAQDAGLVVQVLSDSTAEIHRWQALANCPGDVILVG